jgi:hypothetical protein
MDIFTIKQRGFAIHNDEIVHRIKSGGIEYIHFYRVKDSGGISIIAKPPNKDEPTLGKYYQKIVIKKGCVSLRTPKFLSPHVDKKVWLYTERLNPEDDELFRIKPIDFNLNGGRVNNGHKNDPYFTSRYNLVISRHYLNENITHKINRLKVSFNRCSVKILNEGYLFIFMINGGSTNDGMGGGLYALEKRLTNMRTMPVTRFSEFLNRHDKKVQMYKYFRTVSLNGCPYGLIVFKEVLQDV